MKRTRVYEGKILGLSVYKGRIEGRRVTREVVEHGGAAAILAFDERDRLIMVRQHRFPHGHVLEIPAGVMEAGEDPKECAFRELEEETGYRARGMSRLLSYYPSIGYNSEIIHCFVASGVRDAGNGQSLDEDEIISVEKVGIRRVMRMIRTGKIQDSKTICAVMTYAAKKGIRA